jgi:ABC-type multidrug transport system fused ATPase/permease subunit
MKLLIYQYFDTPKKIFKIIEKNQIFKSYILGTFIIISMLLETLSIGLIIPIITIILNPNQLIEGYNIPILTEIVKNYDYLELLLITLSLLAIFYLIKNLFLFFFMWWQQKFFTEIYLKLSERLLEKYFLKNYSFHLTTNSSLLIRNIIEEANRFSAVFNSLSIVIAEVLVLIGIVSILFVIEPIGVTIIFFPLILALISFNIFTRSNISNWGEKRVESSGKRLKHLMESFAGIKEIIKYDVHRYFFQKFKVFNLDYAIADRNFNIIQQAPKLWIETILVFIICVFIYFMTYAGNSTASLIPFVAGLGAASFRLMPSMNKILLSLQTLKYSFTSIDILYREIYLDKNNNMLESFYDKSELKFENKLLFEDISFSYEDNDKKVLNNFNIEIKKNTAVGIIGESGSGKSTFIDILIGLLKFNKGNIFLDDNQIQQFSSNWTTSIGYVPQNIHLIDDTIKRNVAFGINESEIDISRVNKALQKAQLKNYIDELENGIETKVGERGVRISGGQRQRIGIARALYYDPSILILDESTSALDKKTEDKIMEDVYNFKSEITLIIISHKDSILRKCDKIMKIQDGKISNFND